MPRQQSLPTWLAWNNANFPTASGIQDLRTGQEFPAGGLGLGDFFEATEKEANSASALTVGLLHSGQYRLVHVDSGATPANVKTGTVGYLRAGMFAQNAVVTAPGTGGTPGTYNIAATLGSGGGAGAVVQVTVGPTGVVQSATVLAGGQNYITPPLFSLAVTGGSGTVAAQLNSSPNEVTSYDQAVTQKSLVRPVVYLNSITPGNYGFVQELGVATLLSNGVITANNWVNSAANGLAVDGGAAGVTPATIGQSIDAASAAGQMFKVYLTGPEVQD